VLEHEKSLNEGTYVSVVIMPAIRAALKDTPFIISSGERQSCASADRKGGNGRKPDIMVEVRRENMHEILYAECSRVCIGCVNFASHVSLEL